MDKLGPNLLLAVNCSWRPLILLLLRRGAACRPLGRPAVLQERVDSDSAAHNLLQEGRRQHNHRPLLRLLRLLHRQADSGSRLLLLRRQHWQGNMGPLLPNRRLHIGTAALLPAPCRCGCRAGILWMCSLPGTVISILLPLWPCCQQPDGCAADKLVLTVVCRQDGRTKHKWDGAQQPSTETHLRLRHAWRAVPKGGLDIKLLCMGLQVVSLIGQRLSLSLGMSLHTVKLATQVCVKAQGHWFGRYSTEHSGEAQILCFTSRMCIEQCCICCGGQADPLSHRTSSSSAHLSMSMGLRLGCQVLSLSCSLQLCLGMSVSLLLQRHSLLSVVDLAHPCTGKA